MNDERRALPRGLLNRVGEPKSIQAQWCVNQIKRFLPNFRTFDRAYIPALLSRWTSTVISSKTTLDELTARSHARKMAETDSGSLSPLTARKKAWKMPLLRCQDPECGHEWFERSRLAEGADCEECGGPAVPVGRDDDPETVEETSTKPPGRYAGARYAFSRKAAQALLRKHKIDRFPIPVDDIARREGLTVMESASLGNNIRGRLVGDVIEVASGDSAVVKRFSIAHELGHHSMGTVHNQGREEEREADAFASELLVPRDKLQERLKETSDVRKLARYFFVSQQVIQIAINQLNKGRGR